MSELNLSGPALDEVIAHNENDLSALRAKLQELTEQIKARKECLDMLVDERTRRRLAKSPGAAPDWPFLLHEDGSQARYRAMVQELADRGLAVDGYSPKTLQYVVRISLLKDSPDNLKAGLKAIEEVFPFLKPFDTDGWVYVSVLEHTLSKNGSIYLRAKPDLSAFECVRRYGSRNIVLFQGSDLTASLEFVQQNHFLE